MYSHEIAFFLKHEKLGRLPGYFRTTEDAIDLHIKVLNERAERGEVCGITVKRINYSRQP